MTTTGSKTLYARVTMVCRARTISHAAGIGSLAPVRRRAVAAGAATVTKNSVAAGISVPGPGREGAVRYFAENTCRP